MLVLPPRYLGRVGYYAVMARAGKVCVYTGGRFNKRDKDAHRCRIADANGVIDLTAPIAKPRSMMNARWDEILLSGHNEWWNVHFMALQSAYGRTPYFEYYADDFAGIINGCAEGMRLTDFTERLDRLVLRLGGFETEVLHSACLPDGCEMWNGEEAAVGPYYQTRMHRRGFTPGLSIVDLLFNYGPETALILRGEM